MSPAVGMGSTRKVTRARFSSIDVLPSAEGEAKNRALPLATRAPGAAAAMGVRIGVVRRLGVNDARDVLHVDAARGDVGRHEHPQLAAFEIGESAVALGLLHLAGDRAHRESAPVSSRATRATSARVRAKTSVCSSGHAKQEIDDGVEALARVDQMNDVLDVGIGGAERRALDVRGVDLDLDRRALRTSCGKVAEMRCVRCPAGAYPRMASRSSRKPRSSMRSASSSTMAPSSLGSMAPRLRWSSSRPGVPTTIDGPLARARRSSW